MIPADLVRDARRLLDIIKERDFVRIIGHYDADGISAASVLSLAIKQLDIPFQTRILTNLSNDDAKIHVEGAGSCVLLADLGSSTLDALDAMTKHPVVTIDHHAPPSGTATTHVLQINAHHYKLDGATEVSASMLALAVAIAWDERNWGLIRPALLGAIGDKQLVVPPIGLNKYLIDEAKKKGLIEERTELFLDPGPMDESFTYAIDPHFPGIKDGAGASAFLEKVGIAPRTRYSDLNRADRRKLTSLTMLDMASAGSEPEAIRTAVRRRFVYKPDGAYADHLSRLIDSCGRSGMGGTGVALACGGAHALQEAESISMQFKRKVHEGTLFLKSNGIEERRNLHHFKWGDPAVTGILAEITTLYLGRHGKPVFGSAAVDGRIKISSRTTRALVARGVNLSEVCKRAADACSGLGGGHNIASGATIPEPALDRFLEGADRVIGEQLAARKA